MTSVVSLPATLPSQVRPPDYQSDLDNRCVWGVYEKEGVRAAWIFIMTLPVYWLWYGGHTQVRLSGLQELGREEGGSELIAHIRVIQVLPVADNWIDEDAYQLVLTKWWYEYRKQLTSNLCSGKQNTLLI